MYVSIHVYYIDSWWFLHFSNSETSWFSGSKCVPFKCSTRVWDLPFQIGFPIHKEAFPVFLLLKPNEMVWFPRTRGFGFPTNIGKNIKRKWHFLSLSDCVGCGWHGLDLRPHGIWTSKKSSWLWVRGAKTQGSFLGCFSSNQVPFKQLQTRISWRNSSWNLGPQ